MASTMEMSVDSPKETATVEVAAKQKAPPPVNPTDGSDSTVTADPKVDTALTSTHATKDTLGKVARNFRLDGKVAVVTGGARGLGFSMASALCESGLKGIAILDVLKEHGDQACADLHATYGTPAEFYKVDVRDDKAVREAVEGIMRDFGRLDILICSAGIADVIKAEEYPVDRWRRVIDINLTGSFLCAQACAQAMIRQNTGGSIIFIASMSGHIVNSPQPQAAYNASKAGVIHMMKSLAAEWAPYRIRCNSISPGYMNTALTHGPEFDPLKHLWSSKTPMGRMGDVDELSNCAVYLAGNGSSFVTGSDILIDGGYCIL